MLLHHEELVQMGIFRDAHVYREWHVSEIHLPSSPLGEKCQGMTPDNARETMALHGKGGDGWAIRKQSTKE